MNLPIYNNIPNMTKTFHPINRKSLLGKFYAIAGRGFRTMHLLILL